MNIIFFGSSDYCLPVINVLYQQFNLSTVITKSISNPVSLFAEKKNITIFTPHNVAQLLELKTKISSLKAKLAVVADYGLIIPQDIFQLPEFSTINIHFSRLPQFRGPSPVPQVILSGQTTSWVSLIKMTEKVDAGPIIKQLEYQLNPQKVSARTLYEKLFHLISFDFPDIIKDYLSRKLVAKKQDEKKASYTRKLTRQDGYLLFTDFRRALLSKSADFPTYVERAVRAFDPWPGVWTILPSKKRLKIIKSHLENHKLIPDIVQLEGKKEVTFKQFLEGYPEVLNQIII
ncbi:hypothetical protein A3D78_06505 [Candidatus Gottesmanbacteria bacterium RIFCSPHIGHO2_02_FULL_39_14]|uniref:methionyl-tRNA formyltransferase n=1 Tax=Candidatus Gottesmanbacteria bacterium RIFCSPHIGHO2_02_FULL_39_14 TaxID=1798383 RepID=A0A1F5ZX06_9BACT|nr:MAG: hypothetical protein A3D78_06505 [Candidatus Gottesmanbacteria bacterium RIFCSPHIGHO2_02_FULL_39_14]